MKSRLEQRPPVPGFVEEDRQTGDILFDGQPLDMPHRAQRVLADLVRSAPGKVSRQVLIERHWHGRYLTGDKGLRQAVWTIRKALGDDPRRPTYLRTLPREGYQWIGPAARRVRKDIPDTRMGQSPRLATAALVSATLLILAMLVAIPANHQKAEAAFSHAEVSNNALVAQLENGCHVVYKARDGQLAGFASMSLDHSHVMVPFTRRGRCRVALITAGSDRVQEFDCPAEPSPITGMPGEKTI